MSELKAHNIKDLSLHDIATCDFYLKSEADKVINELKAQKAQAEDDCAYWKMSEGNAVNAMHETEEYAMQLYKELRHHKYKRCLAMAKWCNDRYILDDCLYELGKTRYYERWEKRWLEIAEKFKHKMLWQLRNSKKPCCGSASARWAARTAELKVRIRYKKTMAVA